MQWSFVLALVPVALVAVATAAARPQPRLVLPYDLAVRGGSVYVADGLRHQILRYDLATRRMTVVAGTGRAGTSGDGGPARRARLTEPTELVFDRAGNLYFSDVNQGRVRRIDRRGVITTVARVPAAAGLSVDPGGRYLAIASIEGWVYRLRPPVGAPRAAGRRRHRGLDGRRRPSRGREGERPARRQLRRRGQPARGRVLRRAVIDPRPHRHAVPPPDVQGRPGRGRHVLPPGREPERRHGHAGRRSGRVLRVVGTGRLGRHADRVAIDRVGFLPSDVELVGGALLIAQTEPVPAIRRLRAGAGR